MHSTHYFRNNIHFLHALIEESLDRRAPIQVLPIPAHSATTMADPTSKSPRNLAGPYYVDTSCIDCDLCRGMAPAVFRRDEDRFATYVWRQPITASEFHLAEEARAACPTESIGDDG
jgi:ferredoxin